MRRSLATGPWRADVDGPLVEAVLQEVDAGIGGNHVLGEVDIGALESCRGLIDGLCDQR